MNLVGKIFVVFIFVMSLVFMAFAMAVYTTQQNWREVVMLAGQSRARARRSACKYQLEKSQARQQGTERHERQARKGVCRREGRQDSRP